MNEIREKIQEGYRLNIEEILRDAFEIVKRNLTASMLFTSIYLLLNILLFRWGQNGLYLQIILAGPFVAGYYYAFYLDSYGEQPTIGHYFQIFQSPLKFIGAHFLVSLITAGGFFLYYLPGVYFLLAYFLTLPFLIHRDLNIWQAMEASRMIITRRFGQFFLLFLILVALNLVGALLFGVGLLVTLPFTYAAFHVALQQIFPDMRYAEEVDEDQQEDSTIKLDMFR